MSNSMEIPTGPFPDEYYTENRGSIVIGVSSLFLVLETIAVILRIISRRLGKTNTGWDDIIVIPAAITCVALCIVCIVVTPAAGIGRHTLAILINEYEKISMLGKYGLLLIPALYIIAANLPKLVILHLFLRIFTDPAVRVTTHVLQIVLVLQTVAVVLTVIFQCNPIHLLWTTMVREGRCVNIRVFFICASIPNVITDLIMLAIPLPSVWRLQTTTQIKVGVALTFLTGSIGLTTSIVRLVGFATVNHFNDPHMRAVNLLIYSLAEPGTYLIAACLPTYRPLLAYLQESNFLTMLKSKLMCGEHGNFTDMRSYFQQLRKVSGTTAHSYQKGNLRVAAFTMTATEGQYAARNSQGMV